jgi:nucleotide-binding universal stress UspA family protein
MELKTILVAFDTSPQSEKAFTFGLDLAVKYAAELVVLAVARPPEPAESVETEAMLENAQAFYEEHFVALREKAALQGLNPRFMVHVGHPAEQIIRAATETKADLIAMGHRGKSTMARWLLGSISKRVLSYAPCDVLIVR